MFREHGNQLQAPFQLAYTANQEFTRILWLTIKNQGPQKGAIKISKYYFCYQKCLIAASSVSTGSIEVTTP